MTYNLERFFLVKMTYNVEEKEYNAANFIARPDIT